MLWSVDAKSLERIFDSQEIDSTLSVNFKKRAFFSKHDNIGSRFFKFSFKEGFLSTKKITNLKTLLKKWPKLIVYFHFFLHLYYYNVLLSRLQI